ncbi:hypothetical protein SRHO_G00218910 [Serrasalmus rhombeus]
MVVGTLGYGLKYDKVLGKMGLINLPIISTVRASELADTSRAFGTCSQSSRQAGARDKTRQTMKWHMKDFYDHQATLPEMGSTCHPPPLFRDDVCQPLLIAPRPLGQFHKQQGPLLF